MNDYTTPQSNSPEIWKDIPGYEGVYQASNSGYVKRVKSAKYKTGHVLSPAKNKSGYCTVSLYRDKEKRSRLVHSLVMAAFCGVPASSMEVNHKNGIKTDNRLSNLEYVTRSENQRHSIDVLGKKSLSGEESGMAKLTDSQVKDMRLLYSQGNITQRELAALYGIKQMTVWCILVRRTWRHVE